MIFSGLIGLTLLCLPRAQPGVFKKVVKSVDLFCKMENGDDISFSVSVCYVIYLATAPSFVGVMEVGISRVMPVVI